MIRAIMFWNEPNNLSHWNFNMDPGWEIYAQMTRQAARTVRSLDPSLRLVLGGISPIDATFIGLMKSYGVLDDLDVVAVHGFPLDWNHWTIDEWPRRIAEIEAVSGMPVWVTEVGVSTFGADEVQVFGIKRTMELLIDRVERVYWYSLLDLPPEWEATTRHKEDEGSAYYRHFYMGLIRADGTPKPALAHFDARMGMCQWIHFRDHRLDFILDWMRRLNVKQVRTGISWADWHRPGAKAWFDHQMATLADFDCLITLCFTPPSRGRMPVHTSPPLDPDEYAGFAAEVVERYSLPHAVCRTIVPAAGEVRR